MDRATLQQRLAEAEQYVLQGMEHIVTQRRLIFELARGRNDTTSAMQLLKQFEDVQKQLIADRNQLRSELAG